MTEMRAAYSYLMDACKRHGLDRIVVVEVRMASYHEDRLMYTAKVLPRIGHPGKSWTGSGVSVMALARDAVAQIESCAGDNKP